MTFFTPILLFESVISCIFNSCILVQLVVPEGEALVQVVPEPGGEEALHHHQVQGLGVGARD